MTRDRLNFDDFTAEIIKINNQRLSVSITKPEKWYPCVSISWWDSLESNDCLSRSASTFYESEIKDKFKAVIDGIF